MDKEAILALGVFALVIVIVVRDFLQNRRLSDAIQGLREANANTKALDLIEPAARKVVPVELIFAFFSLAGVFLKTDEQKEFLAQVKLFMTQITDGLPNTGAVNPNPQG